MEVVRVLWSLLLPLTKAYGPYPGHPEQECTSGYQGPLAAPSFSMEQLKWKNSNLDLRAGRCGFQLWVCQILACPLGPLSLSEPQFLHHKVWEDYAYLINLFRGLSEVRHKACSKTVT